MKVKYHGRNKENIVRTLLACKFGWVNNAKAKTDGPNHMN